MVMGTPRTAPARGQGQRQARVAQPVDQPPPAATAARHPEIPDASDELTDPAVATMPAVASELTQQLEELDRCLERMDTVMALLEADLDRRDAAMRALLAGFPPLDSAEAGPPNPPVERPPVSPRRKRSRRARRRRRR